ncbi:hypothetical protein BDV25DRAFT_137043 [Aspergillus avenaceus]|uniref:Uncharacterized protein n=1 Tax=Aspergillus avenaceus TaxID=36643 RepID=A0A5N6U3X6_ASPAV|nr:hypothetical protein BDV25DRAFT_137043 [Aspergillus avenaceus]
MKAYSDESDYISDEPEKLIAPISRQENKRFRSAIKALFILAGLMIAGLFLILYLTIQLGKEREFIQYLEQQKQAVENSESKLGKRIDILWTLGAILWTGNQIFALYGLATSCSEFSSSAGTAAMCIWGALSTTATFIGAGYTSYNGMKAVAEKINWLGTQSAWKREDYLAVLEADVAELTGHISQALKVPVTHDGFMRHDHPRLRNLNLTEGALWPVFHFYNHQNTGMHMTVTGMHDTHMAMSFGFGHKSDNGSDIHKREAYNDERFSNGGIDFTSCWDSDFSHYTLNTGSDYQQMDRDMQCYYPDLASTWGAEVQIFDESKRVTIGSGSIAAFRGSDHASSISVMPGCPVGVTSKDSCKAA